LKEITGLIRFVLGGESIDSYTDVFVQGEEVDKGYFYSLSKAIRFLVKKELKEIAERICNIQEGKEREKDEGIGKAEILYVLKTFLSDLPADIQGIEEKTGFSENDLAEALSIIAIDTLKLLEFNIVQVNRFPSQSFEDMLLATIETGLNKIDELIEKILHPERIFHSQKDEEYIKVVIERYCNAVRFVDSLISFYKFSSQVSHESAILLKLSKEKLCGKDGKESILTLFSLLYPIVVSKTRGNVFSPKKLSELFDDTWGVINKISGWEKSKIDSKIEQLKGRTGKICEDGEKWIADIIEYRPSNKGQEFCKYLEMLPWSIYNSLLRTGIRKPGSAIDFVSGQLWNYIIRQFIKKKQIVELAIFQAILSDGICTIPNVYLHAPSWKEQQEINLLALIDKKSARRAGLALEYSVMEDLKYNPLICLIEVTTRSDGICKKFSKFAKLYEYVDKNFPFASRGVFLCRDSNLNSQQSSCFKDREGILVGSVSEFLRSLPYRKEIYNRLLLGTKRTKSLCVH